MAENVYSSAKIVREDSSNIKKFELTSFNKGSKHSQEEEKSNFVEVKLEDETQAQAQNQEVQVEQAPQVIAPAVNVVDNSADLEKIEPMFLEFDKLSQKMEQVSQKLNLIEQDSITKGKELDTQVVKAIKDLKQYATFFEQATFQLESKLLKTSISIAQKIINIEVGENSSKIAKQTISQLLTKLKSASKVKIHLNPKDYHILKKELELEPFIELFEDANVVAGGVVIASDLGNYDGSIEAKLSSMLESLDLVI